MIKTQDYLAMAFVGISLVSAPYFVSQVAHAVRSEGVLAQGQFGIQREIASQNCDAKEGENSKDCRARGGRANLKPYVHSRSR